MTDMIMEALIPSDLEASNLASQFNMEYGLSWIPEYVQYLSTKMDVMLDDNLMDYLTFEAHHEQLTTNV